MAVSLIALTLLLNAGQTPAPLVLKELGTTGLSMRLPEGELKAQEGSSDNNQTFRVETRGVEMIITYREAPEGTLSDIEFAANAAAGQLPGTPDQKPTFTPLSVSGLQARKFKRGTLAAGLYIQAGEKSWRILSRIKDASATKTRDALLDSASVQLDTPAGWRKGPLKNSKMSVALPTEPDIALGSIPDLFRMTTFSSVTDEAIVTIAEIQTVKGKGPSLIKQLDGLDADLHIPPSTTIYRKSIQPLKVSDVEGYRVDYEFSVDGNGGVFSAMLLVRGDDTWRILVSRKKSDAAGANIANCVLNSIRIAK